MDTITDKEYNHISIFLFLIPLLHSVYLECQLYVVINMIWLGTGFTYHYTYFIKDELTGMVNYFRWIDIVAVHTLIPYITYYSTYHNNYYYTGIGSICLLITLFYFNLIRVKHRIIHVIASFGVYNSINSCYLNKETCQLCHSNLYNITKIVNSFLT